MRARRHPWRNAIVTAAVLLPVIGFVVYSSFQVSEYECDVCITFNGRQACRTVAARSGPLVRVESLGSDELQAGQGYDLAALCHEQSISTNTAAAGGNAQLMTMA